MNFTYSQGGVLDYHWLVERERIAGEHRGAASALDWTVDTADRTTIENAERGRRTNWFLVLALHGEQAERPDEPRNRIWRWYLERFYAWRQHQQEQKKLGATNDSTPHPFSRGFRFFLRCTPPSNLVSYYESSKHEKPWSKLDPGNTADEWVKMFGQVVEHDLGVSNNGKNLPGIGDYSGNAELSDFDLCLVEIMGRSPEPKLQEVINDVEELLTTRLSLKHERATPPSANKTTIFLTPSRLEPVYSKLNLTYQIIISASTDVVYSESGYTTHCPLNALALLDCIWIAIEEMNLRKDN